MRCCYGILLLGLFAGCMESAPTKTSNTDDQGNPDHIVNKPIVNDPAPLPDATVPRAAPEPGSSESAIPPALTQGTRRDNTAVNERDQSSAAKTPLDQGNSSSDITITAGIRQKIVNHKGVNDEGMSINARNVKIISEGQHVTLRGPVANAEEKALIEKFAKEIAGPDNVTSQLELAPSTTP